jgi:hypothetical protein
MQDVEAAVGESDGLSQQPPPASPGAEDRTEIKDLLR